MPVMKQWLSNLGLESDEKWNVTGLLSDEERIRWILASGKQEAPFPALQFYLNAHPYIALVLCCVGLSSNMYFLSLLSIRTFRTWVNLLLSLVAICNSCLILTYGIFTIHFQVWYPDFCAEGRQTYGWALFGVFHAHSSVVFYGWSMGLVGYTGLQRVQKLRRMSFSKINNKFTKHYIKAVSVVFGVVLIACVPVFVATGVEGVDDVWCPNLPPGSVFKVGKSWTAKKYPKLNVLTFWSAGVILKVVPCLGIAIGICMLLRQLREFESQRVRRFKRARRAERHRAISMSLALVLALFLLTQLPQLVLNVGLAVVKDAKKRQWVNRYCDLADMLSLLNNCVSFPLYCITEKTNRLHVRKLVGICFRRPEHVVISSTGTADEQLNARAILAEKRVSRGEALGQKVSLISASPNDPADEKRFFISSGVVNSPSDCAPLDFANSTHQARTRS